MTISFSGAQNEIHQGYVPSVPRMGGWLWRRVVYRTMAAFSESTRTNIAEVVEVRFSIEVTHERVPGLAIMPRLEGGPYPLVIIQHPGTGE